MKTNRALLVQSKISWLLISLAHETDEASRHNTCLELNELYSLISGVSACL